MKEYSKRRKICGGEKKRYILVAVRKGFIKYSQTHGSESLKADIKIESQEQWTKPPHTRPHFPQASLSYLPTPS